MRMEAMLYEALKNQEVLCHVCEHRCLIPEGKRGICGVRENQDGVLHALNYPYTVAASIDPIEKKPLRGFFANTRTYSFATEGCNFSCDWCQNHEIAKSVLQRKALRGTRITPKEHVNNAIRYHCPSISYTYTEPTIFLEYALETMKLAHQEKLKNVWVSNGYMSQETLQLILPYLDAVNIDYKASDNTRYLHYTKGQKDIVLRNMKAIKKAGVHLEVTCLIVPGVNDQEEDLRQMFEDLHDLLGSKQILHISRFYSAYKMLDTKPTEMDTMILAENMAKDIGFESVYLGNV
jgi:pyruvate formate lyase activating enzyme